MENIGSSDFYCKFTVNGEGFTTLKLKYMFSLNLSGYVRMSVCAQMRLLSSVSLFVHLKGSIFIFSLALHLPVSGIYAQSKSIFGYEKKKKKKENACMHAYVWSRHH